MAYLLRFVQQYDPSAAREFLELEAQFRDLERRSPHLPQGKRYQPVSGAQPTHTLIWECECGSLAEVDDAIQKLKDDPTHTILFEKQAPYIRQAHTEIHELLEL